jgi:cell division protein FtsI (penicillin-binding protein 3)
LIPNAQFYDKAYRGHWNGLTVISISIGQGEILATPLQIANLGATIANRGYFITPHIVKEIQDNQLDSIYRTPRYTTIEKRHYESVVEGMRAAATGGTCRMLSMMVPELEACGKTGTAQISQGAAGYKTGRTNYLVSFCGYFPSEAPKYSCIVSIQKPGLPASGGLMAGSVFGKIAERVYAKDLRLPLTNAIDTNSVVIPDVKAGEMNDTKRVLDELKIQSQAKFEIKSGKETWGSTHAAPKSVILESRDLMRDFVPSVIGMGARDAVYLLESRGIKVNLVGVGKVKSQSIANGTRVRKGQTIVLHLN